MALLGLRPPWTLMPSASLVLVVVVLVVAVLVPPSAVVVLVVGRRLVLVLVRGHRCFPLSVRKDLLHLLILVQKQRLAALLHLHQGRVPEVLR